MACRNMQKAEETRQELLKLNPSAKLKLLKVDLGSLESVRHCVDEFRKGKGVIWLFSDIISRFFREYRMGERGCLAGLDQKYL